MKKLTNAQIIAQARKELALLLNQYNLKGYSNA